jgi:hypothetical protein
MSPFLIFGSIIAYIILLYVWYMNSKVLPGFTILIIINILLNLIWIYVFYDLRDYKSSLIISILLLSSSIGIILQLQQGKLIFMLYMLWILLIVFKNYDILKATK